MYLFPKVAVIKIINIENKGTTNIITSIKFEKYVCKFWIEIKKWLNIKRILETKGPLFSKL